MTAHTHTFEIDALLRLPQVLAVYPVSRSVWYDGVNAGRYPKPLKIGARASAWRSSDIKKLIDSLPTSDSYDDDI